MTELHPIPVPASIWSLVGMDLIGPLKVTTRRNQFILTMTCYFSKSVEAFALQISQQIVLLGVFMQHTVDMVHQMTSLLTRRENL